jgi:hypothetical protein
MIVGKNLSRPCFSNILAKRRIFENGMHKILQDNINHPSMFMDQQKSRVRK